jgi:hypothetical protein
MLSLNIINLQENKSQMLSSWKSNGKELHIRNIKVTTYDYDEQKIIVEGFLQDDRLQESYMMTGEKFPGSIIHHMSIRLLVNCSNLLIEDIDCDLITVPREACHETNDCLAPIKGLIITRGFTAKVKNLIGGNKGCAHLTELLLAMDPAAIQGYAAYQARKPASVDPDRAKLILQFLVNTCHVWRENGPFVEKLKTMFNIK